VAIVRQVFMEEMGLLLPITTMIIPFIFKATLSRNPVQINKN
jgi:hypothetical protein